MQHMEDIKISLAVVDFFINLGANYWNKGMTSAAGGGQQNFPCGSRVFYKSWCY